ncbi:MAG: substrate-binding domain-containing protein [Rubrivivax sp.]|nr:substrate-binding domain-containing protein [Rubrivivax sp.]
MSRPPPRHHSPAVAPPATLRAVAAAAGVSPSTVSRILTGNAPVSALKQAAVQQAIAQLGFVPNPTARGLAGGRTLTIGVITQSIDSPFYGGALRGIEDVLDRAGYQAIFMSGHWSAATEARCVEALHARRVDGLIVLTGRLSLAALRAAARERPVVVTGRRVRAEGLHAIGFDNQAGARLATEHLLALGHRQIAFIAGDPAQADARARLQGHQAALKTAGVAFRPERLMPGLFTEESGLVAVNRLLDSRVPFTAIQAANDQMAFGACLGLHRRGLRVPQDVSLVGFDDLAAASYMQPPLTTVRHPAYAIGRAAADAMLQLLRGEAPSVPVPVPQMVLRESTQPPP